MSVGTVLAGTVRCDVPPPSASATAAAHLVCADADLGRCSPSVSSLVARLGVVVQAEQDDGDVVAAAVGVGRVDQRLAASSSVSLSRRISDTSCSEIIPVSPSEQAR